MCARVHKTICKFLCHAAKYLYDTYRSIQKNRKLREEDYIICRRCVYVQIRSVRLLIIILLLLYGYKYWSIITIYILHMRVYETSFIMTKAEVKRASTINKERNNERGHSLILSIPATRDRNSVKHKN